MKTLSSILLLLTVITQSFCQIKNDTLTIADPTIFPHNNKFYLYGTVERNSGKGFLVYVSSDLKSWKLSDKNDGYALKKGDAFGTKGFWAPQVFAYHNKFYMAYTANEQIAIAESDGPLGPFTQKQKDSLATDIKQIDPFVFIDDDGKKYLYHVRLTRGNRIFVAEMKDDLSGIKNETLKECIHGADVWENTANSDWPVTEGPTVIKQNNLYYLFYSANDFRNPDYAVGYATSDNPVGPWKKHSGNPIISKALLGYHGTGHGDLFKVKNDWYYVLHTHQSKSRVGPRKSALVRITPGTWMIDDKSFQFLLKK